MKKTGLRMPRTNKRRLGVNRHPGTWNLMAGAQTGTGVSGRKRFTAEQGQTMRGSVP
jgi:hypothetical protein